MDKKIYTYLKDEDEIACLATDIIKAFETKMTKETIDYSFDIAKGTGLIKTVESNTFFNFDTEDSTSLGKFKKALFDEDLEGLTKDQENLLIEDVSEYLKEVSSYIMEKHKTDVRDAIRKNIMPNSTIEDFPFEKIFITSIDIADWSSIPEPQKHLLKIGKKPGAFINTDVIINYVQNRQEETGLSVSEICHAEKEANNPLFSEITDIEQGDKYLYDINVVMFVDYSLAEKSMKALNDIKEKHEYKMSQEEADVELAKVKDEIIAQTRKMEKDK